MRLHPTLHCNTGLATRPAVIQVESFLLPLNRRTGRFAWSHSDNSDFGDYDIRLRGIVRPRAISGRLFWQYSYSGVGTDRTCRSFGKNGRRWIRFRAARVLPLRGLG